MGAAQALSDSNLSQAASAPKAIIDFWSPTCLPCLQFKPIFEDVASSQSADVFMATMNADESPQAVAAYGIQALPTILFLANGNEVDRVQGKMTKEDFQAKIAQTFSGSGQPQNALPQVAPSPAPPTPAAPPSPAPVPSTTSATPAPTSSVAAPAASGAPSNSLMLWGLSGVTAAGLLAYLLFHK